MSGNTIKKVRKITGANGSLGLTLGLSSDYVGFYGTTPCVQPSGAGQAAVATTVITTAATSTTPYGFATITQANDIAAVVAASRVLLNQMRSDMVTLGLLKGSA